MKQGRAPMSLYFKAWLFIVLSAAALMTSPDWLPALSYSLGVNSSEVGGFFALVHVLGVIFFCACPSCHLSLFKTDGHFYIYHPWPNKRCSRCGVDHTKSMSPKE
ncbi:hypothetical protein [Agrobacterium larrymoorei]|uniref:Uncharacterized protein n=1 Tax=Agrobacterium larrymoorei TaxID=160699 RepID=A0A4D7DMW7_9HYPH|nr:hypothetical protein [Agrobacterium larrymoorei]QCI96984.1 hypothetical protein CFBP5473_03075 [Agrobacterium larrymoorei]QYA07589.1 hypothetical protein J5285_02320 [Agrobacterium larrymoorei]WHA41628.1 hypothetical protein CFBP5477_003060 [Agrobacterium larrymoorei]